MKDHEFREYVNNMMMVFKTYGHTQQLRTHVRSTMISFKQQLEKESDMSVKVEVGTKVVVVKGSGDTHCFKTGQVVECIALAKNGSLCHDFRGAYASGIVDDFVDQYLRDDEYEIL